MWYSLKVVCGVLIDDWSVTIYGNFAKPLDNHYQTMCWLKRFFKRKKRIMVELHIISSLAKLDHVCLMKYISHLGYN